jgi:hypothetical protein
MATIRRSNLGCAVALLFLAAACDDASADNNGALDGVAAAARALFDAVEADPDTWLTDLDGGQQVNGTLQGQQGGTLTATGWRLATQQDAGDGFHSLYAERLFLGLNGFSTGELAISGTLLLKRHNLDFGPPGGTVIDDVSRTTVYYGSILTTGSVSGTFDIDVHSFAAGTTEWACGTVNGEDYGQGACF